MKAETSVSCSCHIPAEEQSDRRAEALILFSMAVAILSSWLGIWKSLLPFDLVSVFTVLLGGIPIYRETIRSLKARKISMEVSMTVGAIAALLIGEFLPAAQIILFTRLAEFIEDFILKRGRKAIALLLEKRPRKSVVRRDGKQIEIDPDEVKLSDIVIVKPGETIPVDGVIVIGSSIINQAPITGESIPVEKRATDEVFAGSISETGLLEVKPLRIGTDTTFARIIRLVEEAEKTKPRIQKISDKLAAWLVYSALGFAVPTLLITRNPISAISVIVVAGACGVAAGTPLAILAGIGKAARRGVIIKGGVYLEELRRIDTVILDKTGTLTYGEPQVANILALHGCSQKGFFSLLP